MASFTSGWGSFPGQQVRKKRLSKSEGPLPKWNVSCAVYERNPSGINRIYLTGGCTRRTLCLFARILMGVLWHTKRPIASKLVVTAASRFFESTVKAIRRRRKYSNWIFREEKAHDTQTADTWRSRERTDGEVPSQRSELESFDSGAEMVRIYFADRFFVIAFDGQNYWVDEPKEQDGFTSSFRYRFSDLGSACDALIRMMSSAQSVSQVRSAG